MEILSLDLSHLLQSRIGSTNLVSGFSGQLVEGDKDRIICHAPVQQWYNPLAQLCCFQNIKDIYQKMGRLNLKLMPSQKFREMALFCVLSTCTDNDFHSRAVGMNVHRARKCIVTALCKCSSMILFHMTVPQRQKIHAHLFSLFDKSLIRKSVFSLL